MMWDWSHAWACLPQLLTATQITILATLGGGLVAITLGLAWYAGLAGPPLVATMCRLGVQTVRNTPLLVQLYLLYYGLPHLGWSADPLLIGTIGIGVHYAAYAAEVYRGGFAAVPRAQGDAAQVLGLSPAQRFWRILLPQALPPVLPALGNLLIALFKETPLLAAITVIELLGRAKLLGAESFRYLEPFTLVGLLFLVLSLAAATCIRSAERRLRRNHAA